MRFLLDESVSHTLTQRLRDAGFSCTHVRDVGLAGSSDEEVLRYAHRRHLVVITHDKDFGNLIRFPVQKHSGVILLRFQNQTPDHVFPHLLQFLAQQKTLRSRLVILREDGFRIV